MKQALAKREVNLDEPVQITPNDLVDDWLGSVGTKRPRTMNTHRSAILWVLRNDQPPGWATAYDRLIEIQQESVRSKGSESNEASPKRSRTPGRMLPEEDLVLLINTLVNMDEIGARAQYFLLAGVASGARPIEWPDAEWADKDKTILRIFTAKVKSRNAWNKIPPLTFTADDPDNEVDQMHDSTYSRSKDRLPTWYEMDFERRLSSLNLTRDELEDLRSARYLNGVRLFRDVAIETQDRTFVRLHLDSVKNLIASVQANQKDSDSAANMSVETIFKKYYYQPVRHCIWRACKKVFVDGRIYSPVDTRSTFSANRKSINGLEGAAKELGHTVTTAKDYYAPASKAWARYRPAPVQANPETQAQTTAPKNGAQENGPAGHSK